MLPACNTHIYTHTYIPHRKCIQKITLFLRCQYVVLKFCEHTQTEKFPCHDHFTSVCLTNCLPLLHKHLASGFFSMTAVTPAKLPSAGVSTAANYCWIETLLLAAKRVDVPWIRPKWWMLRSRALDYKAWSHSRWRRLAAGGFKWIITRIALLARALCGHEHVQRKSHYCPECTRPRT